MWIHEPAYYKCAYVCAYIYIHRGIPMTMQNKKRNFPMIHFILIQKLFYYW